MEFCTYFSARRSRDLRSLDVERALSRCYDNMTEIITLTTLNLVLTLTLVKDLDRFNKEERKLKIICEEYNEEFNQTMIVI